MISIMELLVWLSVALAAPPLSQEGREPGGAVVLTRPDGTPIYILPNSVAFVRLPLATETGRAIIVFNNGNVQAVQETYTQIEEIMRRERSHNERDAPP